MRPWCKLAILVLVLSGAAAAIQLSVSHQHGPALVWDLFLLLCLAGFLYLWLRITTRYGPRHLLGGLPPQRRSKR